MKNAVFITAIAIGIWSCDKCATCEIEDDQGILDEVGDRCDDDFYDRCVRYDTTFPHVDCKCNSL